MSAAVRRAEAADLDGVWAIAQEYFASDDRIIGEDRSSVRAYLAEPNRFWLAEDAAEVVGCVAMRPLANVSGAAELRRMYVRPSYRGTGLADALIDAVEAEARRGGYAWIYLDTHAEFWAAIRLYERRGYARIERYNDNPVAQVFMRKPTGA